jgi:hypothetical protein
MTKQLNPVSASNLLQDALVQSAFMEAQHQDNIDFESDDIFYAIDSNILPLISNPADNAIARDKLSFGVGDVFRHDNEDRQRNIAASIGFYLSNSLAVKQPFIVFPPIDLEIRAYLSHLQREYQGRISKPAEDHSNAFSRAAQAIATAGVSLSASHLHSLRDAYLIDGEASAILARANTFLREGKILRSDVAATSAEFPDLIRAALTFKPSVDSMIDLAYRKNQWLKAFDKIGRQPSPRLDRDAEALARLCIANARLQRANGSNAKQVIKYISLDYSILVAAQSYEDQNFENASHLIRHPRCFLGEAGVLGLTTDTETQVAGRSKEGGHEDNNPQSTLRDILFVLTGSLNNKPSFSKDNLTKFELSPRDQEQLKNENAGLQHAINMFVEKWTAFESQVSNEAPPSAIKKLEDWLGQQPEPLVQGNIESLRRLIEEIHALQKKTWDDLWKTNIQTRYLLQSEASNEDLPSRDVPLLCFEGRPKLQAFLVQAKDWIENVAAFDGDAYDQQRKDVLTEDPSGYGDALAHSFLLALHMQWETAAILAARAKEIALTEGTNKPGGPNGREAFYFEAFCKRHGKQSANELHNSRKEVAQAQDIFNAEVVLFEAEQPEIAAVYPHDVISLRFDAELVANEMTEALTNWWDKQDDIRDELVALMSRFVVLQMQCLAKIAQLNGLKDEPPDNASYLIPKRQLLQIANQTLSRVQRNIVAIALQAGEVNEESRNAWKSIQSDESKTNPKSFYLKILYTCGQVVFDGQVDHRIRSKLNSLKSELASVLSVQLTFKYDRERYTKMIDHALSKAK